MASVLDALTHLMKRDDLEAQAAEAPALEPETAQPIPLTGGPSVGGEPVMMDDPTIPKVITRQDRIAELMNPDEIAKIRAGVKEPSLFWRAMQYSPRLRGIAAKKMGEAKASSVAAENAISDRMKMANQLQQDEFKDRELKINEGKESRDQETFRTLESIKRDPEAKKIFIAQMGQYNPAWASPENRKTLEVMRPEVVWEIAGKTEGRDKAISAVNEARLARMSDEKIKRMDIDAKKTDASGAPKLTKAQEAEDAAYGKERVKRQELFGKYDADKKEAQDIISKLTGDRAPTNPVSQFVPKAFGLGPAIQKNVNPEYYSVAERAKNLLRRNMRGSGLLPPGPASDVDVENAIKTIWDDNLPNSENAARLQQFMERTAARNAQDQKRDEYYSKHGTLAGFADLGSASSGNTEKTVVKKLVSPSTGKTKIIYSDGTEEIQ